MIKVTFFNAGYCTQSARLAGRQERGKTRFYAVCLHINHPEYGQALIDTGYSTAFFKATRGLGRLYRWLTPVHLDSGSDARSRLRDLEIDPDAISRIFITHFHADHIAGLKSFPYATFIHRQSAYDHLSSRWPWAQLHNGFLPGLMPDDFNERSEALSENAFNQQLPGSNLRCCDYFGDESLLLVDLPGHALGHFGVWINTQSGPLFYITDATWDMTVLEEDRILPRLSQQFQHAYRTYLNTQKALQAYQLAHPHTQMLACHCPRTQQRIAHAD